MRVIITVSLSLALTFFTVSLASKKKQGDRRFNDLHYSKAILFYLKAIEKGDSTVAKNLAESCLHINQPNNAAKWYEVVIDQGEYTDRDILNYIQAVKGTGDYSKYEELTARYSTMPASDGLKEILVKNDQFDIVKTNINTIYSDCSPTFLGDSSLVFMSDRKIDGIKWKKHPWSGEHFYNLLVANITDSLSKLEGVRSLSEQINTKYEEGPATFSSDGQLMIYSGTARRKLDSASNYLRDKEVANMELYLASYDQEEQEWNTPEKFPIADSIYEMEHPYLSPDGNTLYFSSDHPYPGHQGKHDLYKVVKKGESWSDPINLGKGINTEKNEGFPFIQPKTNELYFSSDGHKGLGKLDVFVSAKKGDVYTKAINLGTPVNSYSDDFGVTFNKSMTIGYFSSNRPGGEGLDDIYGIIVNKSSLLLAGVVRDELNTPIDSAIVRLFDKEGNILDSVFTDSLGKYD
ncbi:MAG: hypothetical protein AB8B61_06040, partial [Cyclobacteriaceae bacterium]